jgi:hypothetical protein
MATNGTPALLRTTETIKAGRISHGRQVRPGAPRRKVDQSPDGRVGNDGGLCVVVRVHAALRRDAAEVTTAA